METIFISYSHKDKKWKERIVRHLQVLAQQGHLETWDDKQIGGGEEWYKKIMRAINECRVAILLVSANSLTSEFILKEEVPRLLALREAGQLRLIPLLIEPCSWQEVKWLQELNVRPGDNLDLLSMKRAAAEKAMAAFASEMSQIIAKITEEKNSPPPPAPPVQQRRGPNPSLDYLKCDRTVQLSDFRSGFKGWFSKQPGLPQFHIIYGRKEDRPNSLARRLGELELEVAAAWLQKQKLPGLVSKPIFAEVAWPAVPAGVDQLKLKSYRTTLINNLFAAFFEGEPCDYSDEPEWSTIFANHWRGPTDKPVTKPSIVAISHKIPCWEQATYELAEYYCDFWGKFWEKVATPTIPQWLPQFLLFLHVQYKPDPKPTNWWSKWWSG